MRRESREVRNNGKSVSDKIIMYSIVGVGILTAILVGLLIYSKNLSDDVKEGTMSLEQMNAIVGNSDVSEDTESASTDMGKTVEESKNETNTQNTANTKSNTQNTNNITNTTNTSKNTDTNTNKETVNQETKATTSKTENQKQESKELSFIKPVDGEISKEYAKDITCSKVNAGVPIQNTKLYIVDENERLLPLCCEGELCISGDSVAMGYFKREDLTDKVFKKLNFADEVVYKTGDLAKIDINYELTILGRVDFQVKINGQRVELEEIDKLIQENDEIKSCATVLNSDKKLVCFYVSKGGNKVEAEKLKESLLTKLPTYMVPNFYICLNEMPMTLNNKIDRKALIKMDIKKFMENEVEKAKVMPNTQIESLIYDAWKKVLKKDNFGIDDSFFELGTDSLDAINIQIELMSKNVHIEYSDLSKYQTIRKLAKKIEINESKIEYKIENFDKDYSNILQKNKEVYLPSKYNVKNVILSGATGFLGAHILAEILSSTNSKVFCLIRVKNGLSATKRIKNTLNYFFDDKYDKFIGTRIIPIEADITNMDNFGINKQDMDIIKNGDINFFVHSAACVKHYGRITNFSSINIGGTRAVANFCYENKINMIHISTLSVSGNAFETTYTRSTNTEAIFDESSFYQHQNLNNVYVYTKFRAEEIVLDYMEKGLNANILY